MRRLTVDEFEATMVPEPTRVAVDEEPPFDFWGYVEAIPGQDFAGYDFSAGRVAYAWDMLGTVYQHVLVESETHNVFLALVLDVVDCSVLGHHILDLNGKYGLD